MQITTFLMISSNISRNKYFMRNLICEASPSQIIAKVKNLMNRSFTAYYILMSVLTGPKSKKMGTRKQ